jgi:hypothetical protein
MRAPGGAIEAFLIHSRLPVELRRGGLSSGGFRGTHEEDPLRQAPARQKLGDEGLSVAIMRAGPTASGSVKDFLEGGLWWCSPKSGD